MSRATYKDVCSKHFLEYWKIDTDPLICCARTTRPGRGHRETVSRTRSLDIWADFPRSCVPLAASVS